MPYDELLAIRLKAILSSHPGIIEKRMFGGICVLINGNMACGVYKNDLIVRIGVENHQEAMARPHVKVFDITGKPMRGWVMVEPQGCASEQALQAWVEKGVTFAQSLPPK